MLIGQRLKKRREFLGMTLIDLEKKVKIQRKYIEMIEQNEFNQLPNPHYAIGFIEKYAKTVNLNSKQLLKEHADELPEAVLSAVDAKKTLKTGAASRKDDIHIKPLLIGLIVFFLAVTVLWFCSTLIFKDNSSFKEQKVMPSRNVAVETKTSEPTKKIEEKNKSKINDSKKGEPKKEGNVQKTNVKYLSFDGSTLSYEVTTSETIKLDVKSTARNWIQVYDDNKSEYAYEAITNKTMYIKNGAKQITLISGNAPSMQVFINGQRVIVPKDADNVITRTYQFTINSEK